MDGPKTVPLCKCHDEPMTWSRDPRHGSSGGYWRCRIKLVEMNRRYRQSPQGKAALVRYRQSDKGKANQHRYDTSEKGHARKQRARDKMTWRQRHLDQLRVRRYRALQRMAARQREREERSG